MAGASAGAGGAPAWGGSSPLPACMGTGCVGTGRGFLASGALDHGDHTSSSAAIAMAMPAPAPTSSAGPTRLGRGGSVATVRERGSVAPRAGVAAGSLWRAVRIPCSAVEG